ncbi:MAG: DHHW family protein [Pseudomonadota bacterium]|nr:DHHW family protein [Pseudomonadota bacterium]
MKRKLLTDKLSKITAKGIDKIFVVFFFILLSVPILKISNEEISEKEKRVLAKYPSLIFETKLNEKFGPEFDKWFNDHLGGRNELIKLNSKIREKLDNFNQNEHVLKGNENWLFYKGDNSLNNFQNKDIFTDEQLKKIVKYLVDIDNWAKNNKKSFYFVIVPDKNKIYGEYITSLKKVRPDKEGRAFQLEDYLIKNTPVKVIYLYRTLISNKNKELLYYKHDTHWNDYGAYLSYLEIINAIKKDYNSLIPVKILRYDVVSYETGDLSPLLNYAVSKDNSKYLKPQIDDNSICVHGKRKTLRCKNRQKKLRAFVLCDSFSNALNLYFNNTFNDVKYVRHRDIRFDDLEYIKKNADIIILEIVERYLPNLLHLKFPKD